MIPAGPALPTAVVVGRGRLGNALGEALPAAGARVELLSDGRLRPVPLPPGFGPRIAALSAQRISELDAAGQELACYEAALLVENRLVEMFRPLVVVAVPEGVQIERAMHRDGATEEQAKARIASQLPLAEKVAVADIVIDTTGPLPETERQVDAALATIRARFKLI